MLRFFSLLLFAVLPAAACKWDRDTLAEEAKGGLDTVKAITGWFDRYPPRYYEMRLERVKGELAVRPEALDLYDDAGVACDRLGRYDEAIEWMARKKRILDARPQGDTADHRYRYLANLGSFHMDHWIARPAEQRALDLADLLEAEKQVAAAIELNPEAHFGRERYQLQMIRWLLFKGPVDDLESGTFLGGREIDFLGTDEEAVAGLTGLILLGEGWGSLDLFDSLQQALVQTEQNTLARLAYCRAEELAVEHSSLHPRETVRLLMRPAPARVELRRSYRPVVDDYFRATRAAADQRLAAWRSYQEKRFAEGRHPDTDPDFWAQWREPAFPRPPGLTWRDWAERNTGKILLGGLTAFVLAGVGLYLRMKKIRRWAGGRDSSGSARRFASTRRPSPSPHAPAPRQH